MTRPFEFQPVLQGARVTVRPLQVGDWAELFSAASDPGIWAQHPAFDRHEEPVFRQFFEEAMASGSAFAFVDRERDLLIGSSRYHGYDPATSEIEIGWTFLARSHWGRSYNAEIKRLMLDHAFKHVDTVVFWVGERNVRSRRAMEKLGAKRRGSVHYRDMGGEQPNVIYEIRRRDWRSPGSA